MGLLDDLIRGVIQTDDPDGLAERIVDEWHDGKIGGSLDDALGLTLDEDTAWGSFGASFRLLMKWRENGWPTTCGLCGQSIAAENWAVFEKEDGEQVLTHLRCWSVETKKRRKRIRRK
jgi:hypothetical protein